MDQRGSLKPAARVAGRRQDVWYVSIVPNPHIYIFLYKLSLYGGFSGSPGEDEIIVRAFLFRLNLAWLRETQCSDIEIGRL